KDGKIGQLSTAQPLPGVLKVHAPLMLEAEATGAEGVDLSTARGYLVDTLTGRVVPLVRSAGKLRGAIPSSSTLVVAVANGALLRATPMAIFAMGEDARRQGSAEQPPPFFAPLPPIEGTVLLKGKPAAGVDIVAGPELCALKTQSDAAGRFTVDRQLPLPAGVVVEARSADRVALAVSLGAPLTLELRPSRTMTLTFVDSVGNPVAGVDVEARFAANSVLMNTLRPKTDASGVVKLETGAVDQVLIKVTSPGLAISGPSAVDASVPRASIEIVRLAKLEVLVRDRKG